MIAELEPSKDVVAVTDHHHASTGLSPKEHLLAAFLLNLEAKVQHHVQVPDGNGAIRCFTTDALAGLDDDVVHVGKRSVKIGPRPPHGLRNGMQAVLLKRSSQAQHLWDVAVEQFDVSDAGFSFGDRARFVEHHGIDGGALLEGFDALDQHPMTRTDARADHQGGRGRQSQRARAGDDEGGDQHEHALLHGRSGKVPTDGGRHGQHDDHGDKNA